MHRGYARHAIATCYFTDKDSLSRPVDPDLGKSRVEAALEISVETRESIPFVEMGL